MNNTTKTSLLLAVILYSNTGLCAVGDYNFFESLGNLVVAPQANNPPNNLQKQREHFRLTDSSSAFSSFDPKRYGQWQTITANEAETGAVCGDGSPFEFVVNRSNLSKNLVIFMEGGGACWSHDTCSGKAEVGAISLSVSPETTENSPLGEVYRASSPFTNRFNLAADAVRGWNMVLVPYCSGDVYLGDTTRTYTDKNGNDAITVEHKGMRNFHSVLSWVKSNLEQPAQMLVTGRSAGGIGATFNYAAAKTDLAPSYKSYLINDSGPLFTAPKNGSAEKYPSIFLHNEMRQAYRINKGPGKYLQSLIPDFKSNNFGTIFKGLAKIDPNDRLGFISFQQDRVIPKFSYRLFGEQPDVEGQNILFMKELKRLTKKLDKTPNFGYFLPNYRPLAHSHVASYMYTYGTADIQEQNLNSRNFYSNIMSDNGSVMQSQEYDLEADYSRGPEYQWIVDQLKKALPAYFGD